MNIEKLKQTMKENGYKVTPNDDNVISFENSDHIINYDIEQNLHLVTLKKDLPSTAERIAERERVRQLFKDILN